MVIFHSYVSLPEGTNHGDFFRPFFSPDLLLRIADPTQILSIVPSHLVHFTPDRAWRSDVCFKNLQTTSIHSVFKVKLA